MNNEHQKKRKETDEIRDTIDLTIEEIKKIPDIVSEQLGVNTEKMKEDLIPQLKKQRNRLDDFDMIDEHIDSIRNEIIEPVNEVIEKNSTTSRKFNIIFGIIGVIGTIITLFSLLVALNSNNKNTKPKSYATPQINRKHEEKTKSEKKLNSFNALRSLFSDNFSKECLDLTQAVRLQVSKIKKDLSTKKSDKELKTSLDELLKATVAIESNGCIDRFIANGLFDDIYKSTAAICYKINDFAKLSALIGQYETLKHEKSKEAMSTLDVFAIELEYKKSKDENKYLMELQNLLNKKKIVDIISPETFEEVPLKDYLQNKIDEIKLKSEKENFEIWAFDAPKISNSHVTSFVNELKKEGFVNVSNKGKIDGTWEIPWMYYRDSSVKNSAAYRKVVQKRKKYKIIRFPELYSNSKYAVIKNYFRKNKNLKIIVIL